MTPLYMPMAVVKIGLSVILPPVIAAFWMSNHWPALVFVRRSKTWYGCRIITNACCPLKLPLRMYGVESLAFSTHLSMTPRFITSVTVMVAVDVTVFG